MIKIRYSFVCALAFVFIGCSKPNALTNFNFDKFYGKSLQYTLKNDIVTNNSVSGMLNATYLNAINESDAKNESEEFLVGVFILNDEENDILVNKNYSITLNNVKPDSMVLLEKDSKMYAKMPLYNPWATYYIMKFSKEKLKSEFKSSLTKKQKYKASQYEKINLKLSIDKKQSTTLTFQKVL